MKYLINKTPSPSKFHVLLEFPLMSYIPCYKVLLWRNFEQTWYFASKTWGILTLLNFDNCVWIRETKGRKTYIQKPVKLNKVNAICFTNFLFVFSSNTRKMEIWTQSYRTVLIFSVVLQRLVDVLKYCCSHYY